MYLVDTNFLGTLANVYPRDVFPSLWEKLEDALFADGVFFHDEVDKELAVWERLNITGTSSMCVKNR